MAGLMGYMADMQTFYFTLYLLEIFVSFSLSGMPVTSLLGVTKHIDHYGHTTFSDILLLILVKASCRTRKT